MSTEHLITPISELCDGLFGQYTATDQARGLVYGIVGAGGLEHSAGFGVIDDIGTVPDSDTVFPIASMSKSFVAAGALLAHDRGLVDLDAPITEFFGQFAAGGIVDDPCDPPTLRMLLSMSSGLTEDNSWVDPFIDRPVDDVLAQIGDLTYSSQPGTVFEYSNLGFTLAGLAVGTAVGRSIEDWVAGELLGPLGMTSTWFDNSAPDIRPGARATGYRLDENGGWVAYPPARSRAFAAAGGIQSSVRDLATWITWLGSAFRRPEAGGDGPLSRSSRREMQRLQQIALPSLATRPDGAWRMSVGGYGLGLFVTHDLHHGVVVSHSGGLPGFLLNMTWHPDSGHGMVVLTNSHRGNPVALSEEALQRLLDRERTPARTVTLWPATVELRRRAEQLIRGWDDRLAQDIFAENVDVDRPLSERRAEIERMVGEIGPLDPARPPADITSAATPADVTWSITGRGGELTCMIHLTPVLPPRIQEFEVRLERFDRPRSARPADISPRRRNLGAASLSSLPNTRVLLPDGASSGERPSAG